MFCVINEHWRKKVSCVLSPVHPNNHHTFLSIPKKINFIYMSFSSETNVAVNVLLVLIALKQSDTFSSEILSRVSYVIHLTN